MFIEGLTFHYDSALTWLGAHDLVTEGSWFWADSVTNVSAGYTDWHPGQPDNSGSQDCMVVRKDYHNWDDEHCDLKCHFICQMNVDVVVG